MDCIRPRKDEDKGERLLYINPDECIDCGACEPVRPVKAIFPEDEIPAQWKQYTEMNADYYRLSGEQFKEKRDEAP